MTDRGDQRAPAGAARRERVAEGRRGAAARERDGRAGAAASFASLEQKIQGVPARIMQPRILLICLAAVLTCFGLVMIYSASSVEALAETGDANYYFHKQLIYIAMGIVFAVGAATLDYHKLCTPSWSLFLFVITALILIAVKFAGSSAGGATRWISIAGFRFQPSEFAKLTIVLIAARLGHEFFVEGVHSDLGFIVNCLWRIGIPLTLIVIQPDNGTVMIIGVALIAMLVSGGFPVRRLLILFGVLAVLVVVVVASWGYVRERITSFLNPWADEYDSSYQLTRGLIAFGSGGLFGKGLGMSRMKYSYLPEAHNDFIFSIIGEELGLVGTLGTLALFTALFWQGLKIARSSSDLTGKLVGTGCVGILAAQMLLNMAGVTGCFPMSGKPLPFISYGGSSIISCLGIIGLLVNVSMHTELPETVHDRRRRAMTLADDEDTGVGEARPRASRAPGAGVPQGGAYAEARGASARDEVRGRGGRTGGREGSVPLSSPEEARSRLRVVEGGSGRARIDLGPSASERLRRDDGPTVRTSTESRVRTNGRTQRPRRRR